MKRVVISLLLVALVLFLDGCSCFVSRYDIMRVSSTPSGATVRYQGHNYETPCTVKVQRNREFECEVMMDGYEKEALSSYFTLSTTGALDIIGGFIFLVPIIGIVTPGAYVHDCTEWNVNLRPIQQPVTPQTVE